MGKNLLYFWDKYKHPKQKYIIDIDSNGNLSILRGMSRDVIATFTPDTEIKALSAYVESLGFIDSYEIIIE
jgi:hypothetical protein